MTDSDNKTLSTRVLAVNDESLRLACGIIKKGGLVAFKTETVYGLGADAYNVNAVRDIYRVKNRPADNPLIVHLSRAEDIDKVAAGITAAARELIDKLMPGPLTIVLKVADSLPAILSGGRDSIAVRIPSDKGARDFIDMCGVPIAAPSANTSTRPSPTKAAHVLDDLDGKIALILDGGDCEVGLESTVVDARGTDIILLRHGGVTAEQIEQVTGKKVVLNNSSKEIVSPGTKYRHYAPNVPLAAVNNGDINGVKRLIDANINLNPVVMGLQADIAPFEGAVPLFSLGEDSYSAAKRLFGALRELEQKYGFIIAVRLKEEGLGASVNSRLDKAAAIM